MQTRACTRAVAWQKGRGRRGATGGPLSSSCNLAPPSPSPPSPARCQPAAAPPLLRWPLHRALLHRPACPAGENSLPSTHSPASSPVRYSGTSVSRSSRPEGRNSLRSGPVARQWGVGRGGGGAMEIAQWQVRLPAARVPAGPCACRTHRTTSPGTGARRTWQGQREGAEGVEERSGCCPPGPRPACPDGPATRPRCRPARQWPHLLTAAFLAGAAAFFVDVPLAGAELLSFSNSFMVGRAVRGWWGGPAFKVGRMTCSVVNSRACTWINALAGQRAQLQRAPAAEQSAPATGAWLAGHTGLPVCLLPGQSRHQRRGWRPRHERSVQGSGAVDRVIGLLVQVARVDAANVRACVRAVRVRARPRGSPPSRLLPTSICTPRPHVCAPLQGLARHSVHSFFLRSTSTSIVAC